MTDYLFGYVPTPQPTSSSGVVSNTATSNTTPLANNTLDDLIWFVEAGDTITLIEALGRKDSAAGSATAHIGAYITDATGATEGATVFPDVPIPVASNVVDWYPSSELAIDLTPWAGQWIKLSYNHDESFRRAQVTGTAGNTVTSSTNYPNPFGSGALQATNYCLRATVNRLDAQSITSVNGGTDAAAIGSTVPVVVSGFPTAVNAGTIDGISLSAASSTSITIAGFVDGAMAPRVGAARPLVLTNGTVSGTRNITINSPAGFTSVEILAGFNTGEEDSIVYNFDPPMAAGRLIFFDPTKGTVYSNAGYSGSFTGTQLMWDYDPATKIARSFYVITGADGEVISVVRTLHGSLIKGNFLKGNYLKGNVL